MLKSKLAAGLTPYVPGEQPKGEKVIKLNTNENPYPPSPKAIAALREFDAGRLRLYPDPTADVLRAAIAGAEGVKTENVFVGNGSDEVLSLAFAAFFDADSDPVLFPDITYSFYKVFCSLYNINYAEVPLRPDFTVDIADYMERKTSGIVIANPNAPTAIALDNGDICRLVETHTNRVIIADEAYADFSSQPSLAAMTAKYNNLLVVKTFSKSRSFAGGRLGYAIGNEELITTLRSVKDCFNSYTVNSLTAAVGRAAIEDREYFEECTARIIATREWTADRLSQLGFTVTKSDANFIFAKPPTLGGKEFQARLRARGILVRRFDHPRISDYLRITIGSEEDMREFVKVCAEILG